MSEHYQFTSSRITTTTRPKWHHGEAGATTSKPKLHASEPGLKGFVATGGDFLGVPLYRAVYEGDPDEVLDLDSTGEPIL